MNVEVWYNIPVEHPLKILLAFYFYMTGLSAGSFMLSTMAYGFGMSKFKPIGKVGVIMAVIILGLAPINLLVDMAQPFRFWHLFFYQNPTSPISYGAFLLTLYPLNCTIYAIFMFLGKKRLTKIFGLVGIPLALAVHGYTGFIVALAKGRVLGNTAVMPFLFLVSAMVSGIALMILVVIVRTRFFTPERMVNRALVNDLANLLIGTIALDMFLMFCDITLLLTSDADAHEAASMILTGRFAPYFVGAELIVGGIVPLILLAIPRTKRSIPVVACVSVMVMVGIMAMRYVMVIGGQYVPQI